MPNSNNHQALSQSLQQNCETVSHLLKSLSHPIRLLILCQLITHERSVNELADFCQTSQSAMSQFLGRMKQDGVLLDRRQGHFVYYRISDVKIYKLLKSIKRLYC